MRIVFILISVVLIYSLPGPDKLQAQADVVAGEYFFNSVGNYGDGMPLAINSPDTAVQLDLNIDISGLSTGFHRIYVRFKDSNGKWGQTQHYSIKVDRRETPDLVKGEYFLDQAGSYGSGTPFNIANADSTFSLLDSVDVSGLENGFHRLFVRFRDAKGKWGQTHNYGFRVHHPETYTLVDGEYFFDQADAYGTGTPLQFDSTGSMASLSRQLVVDSLENGFHKLFVRFRDDHGKWSQTHSYMLIIRHEELRFITGGEYFFDPGTDYGQGYALVPDSLGEIVSLSRSMTEGVDSLGSPVQDTVYFRFRDNLGQWSHTYYSEIVVTDCPDELHLRDMQLRGSYRASQRIRVSGVSSATGNLTLNAPDVELRPQFEAPLGPVFTILVDGCGPD